MTTNSEPELTLYSRSGCHLCEDMHALLLEFAGDPPAGSEPSDYTYSIKVVDIDQDAILKSRFNVLVPALYLADQEICHHFLDLVSLTSALDDFRNPVSTNG